MPLSIAVENNKDGTANVTVSGADVSATVEIRTLQIDELWGSSEWVARTPTRVGDGEVEIETGPGAYFFAAVSDGEWSPPVYRIVSASDRALMLQILESVATRVRLLGLEGVDPGNVQEHPVLSSAGIWEVRQPSVLVGPLDQSVTQYADMGSTLSHFGYPVLISCVEAANRSTEKANRWFTWTERLRNAFVDVPLQVANGCVFVAEYIPLSDFQRAWWSRNLTAMFVGLRFRTSERRGML